LLTAEQSESAEDWRLNPLVPLSVEVQWVIEELLPVKPLDMQL